MDPTTANELIFALFIVFIGAHVVWGAWFVITEALWLRRFNGRKKNG